MHVFSTNDIDLVERTCVANSTIFGLVKFWLFNCQGGSY